LKFITAKTAFHHCTFTFITAHFVHHSTLKQALDEIAGWAMTTHETSVLVYVHVVIF